MKLQRTLLFILITFLGINTTEAQLFKRLKNKAKQKLEREVEKTVEKEIDSFTLKKKTPKKNKEKEVSNQRNLRNSTSGSAILKHEKKYGNYNVKEFGKAKLERTNKGVKIFGSWVTHGADIHDGYALSIPTGNSLLFDGNEPTQKQITLSIPDDASLKLSYDPAWDPNQQDEYGRSSAVTKDYQSYNLESGQVVIDVVSKDNIQFSFSGNIQLEQRTKNTSDSENEYSSTFISSSLSGSVDVSPVQFLDNRLEVTSDNTNDDTNFEMPELPTDTAFPAGVYQFTWETVVEMTDLDQNETYKISYLFNPNANYFGINADMSNYNDQGVQGESMVVMDGEDVHIFVETQGMKMRMSQGMMGGQEMQNPAEQMSQYDYSKLQKTGNTKTILGALCYEYTTSVNGTKMQIWAAPSIDLPNWFGQDNMLIDGYILEYTVTSKDANIKSETLAIKDNILKTINPKEYKKMF